MSPARHSNHGFTVIELVTVILLLGILSIGTVRFINDASVGFDSAADRGELSASARQAIQHLAFAIRDALPNSIRVTASGNCLELVPILNGTVYESAPVGTSGISMRSVPFDQPVTAASWRTAIAPSIALYGLSNPGPISPPTSVGPPDTDNLVTLSFAAVHQFAAASPQRRMFAIADPVSYCSDGGRLYRYQNYGYHAGQLGPGALPSTLPNRQVLVGEIGTDLPVFSSTSASLTRNGIVQIDIEFIVDGASLPVSHTTHVRNQL